MGGKASKIPKSELKRSKSISTFGRSSQRSLFQKSKAKLVQINKKLEKFQANDSKAHEELNKQLQCVEKDLSDVSQAIKEKNKQKYGEILKYFQETRQRFEEKANFAQENSKVEDVQESVKPESTPQPVELKLVRVISKENLDVETRKPLARENSEENSPELKSPKVKFGVQVMPASPRISQEMLKRKTLPINEAPKAEFLQIRKMSGSEEPKENCELHNFHEKANWAEKAEPSSGTRTNELYNFPPPEGFSDPAENLRESKLHSFPSSPNSNIRNLQEVQLEELQKRPVDADALQQIETVTKDIDILEERLRYFCGEKGDAEYLELHERFVRSLIKLDNVEIHGDSVVRRERKIAIQRVQELLRILECLVKLTQEEQEPKVVEQTDYDYVGERPEENANAERKPVAATAL